MTYVTAELGSNHDGKYLQALALIDAAAGAGANAVKLQCLPPLDPAWLPKLKAFAAGLNMGLYATPFDPDAVRELADLGVPYIKIASAEIVNHELIEAAAETGIPLILSTGMATFTEIGRALEVANAGLVALLQCTTRYPAPAEQVNLHALETMRDQFDVPVGLSDHTTSTTVPAAAVALGASFIEKHITLDCRLDGPDHPYALEPNEFKTMVDNIREVEVALGDGAKAGPVDGELFEARGRRLRWREGVAS